MATTVYIPTYTIGTWAANVTDDLSCTWAVEPGLDVFDGPEVTTHITDRPYEIGAYRARSYRQGREFTLRGWVSCPNRPAMVAARDRFLGLFPNGEQLALVMDDGVQARTITVELAGKPRFQPHQDPSSADWQLPLYANDPRFLDTAVHSAQTAVGGASTDGLDWASGTPGGLDWAVGSPGGLEWGVSAMGGGLTMDNEGNTITWPVFTVTGPVLNPVIANPATGDTIAYTGLVDTGQTLVIDCSPFSRRVELGGVDRFGLLTSADWITIQPASSTVVTFAGSGAGSLSATWNYAYL